MRLTERKNQIKRKGYDIQYEHQLIWYPVRFIERILCTRSIN